MNNKLDGQSIVNETKEQHPVFKVTPFSKYLAMLLFIVLPFIAGWIGYKYMPAKEVYVEKIVFKEAISDSQIDLNDELINSDEEVFLHKSELQVEDVIIFVKNKLALKFKMLSQYIYKEPKNDNEIVYYTDMGSPAYKLPGDSYYTTYDGGLVLSLDIYENENYTNDIFVRSEIKKTLLGMGFDKIYTHGSDDIGYDDHYLLNNVVCSTDSTESEVYDFIYIRCGQIEKYKIQSEKLKPLFDTIPHRSDSTVFYKPVIADSKVPGYKYAEVREGNMAGFGGARALLYKKSDEPWMYFTRTQEVLVCEQYNTEDLKNAFMGTICFAEEGYINLK